MKDQVSKSIKGAYIEGHNGAVIPKQISSQLPFEILVTQISLSRVLFHRCGPEAEKLRSPKRLLRAHGTQHTLESDDLREPATRRTPWFTYPGACRDSGQ